MAPVTSSSASMRATPRIFSTSIAASASNDGAVERFRVGGVFPPPAPDGDGSCRRGTTAAAKKKDNIRVNMCRYVCVRMCAISTGKNNTEDALPSVASPTSKLVFECSAVTDEMVRAACLPRLAVAAPPVRLDRLSLLSRTSAPSPLPLNAHTHL